MVYLESPSFDPYYNLALEQCIFDDLPKSESYLMLWQNNNAIIVGRYQNTAAEVNASFVRERQISVARRLSGGGAVYHDLGTVNYTLVTDAKDMEGLDLHRFCTPLVGALRSLGLRAEVTGRNDVVIDGQKICGNAQYLRSGRVLHHGSILFDSDLSVLSKALCVPKDKLDSHGAKSVRSRVTNIRSHLKSDIQLQEFKDILRHWLFSGENSVPMDLPETLLQKAACLRDETYATWDWNYGIFPQYGIQKSRRFACCGRIDLSLEVTRGIITNFSSSGDYFGSGDWQDVAAQLIGTRLEAKALGEKLRDFPIGRYYSGLTAEAFIELLL